MSSLILPVYEFATSSWLAPITYRNTMLGYLYPDVQFAVGDVSDVESPASMFDAGFEDYRIVGASGSRKKGCAIFAVGGGDYFTRFFGSNSNAINYGSNLTTECRDIVEMSVNILIVDDGVAATGDCHATASAEFFLAMGVDIDTPFQFRICDPDNNWVAKGTVAYNPVMSGTEYALAIPRSAFKGNSPGAMGARFVQRLVIGIVHQAEVRRVKMSYSVLQFLPWSAVEADILPQTIDAAKRLNETIHNPQMLVEHLLNCLPDSDEEEAFVPALTQVVEADVHGQLTSHPWMIERVYDLFRSRWLRLALAGAVRFNSSMTIPDESLADGEVCIPGVPDGMEVIVFPYPCRWQHDLAIWTNRATPKWQSYKGVIVANAATALTLGRDFDGDFLSWLPAPSLPNVAAAIRSFPPAPELVKPAKQKVDGSLGEIAVRAMDNNVGLITYQIAKAQALEFAEVIPKLAQQLQIEVDSLKNVERADMDLIEALMEPVRKRKVLWLADRKEKDAFTTRPIQTCGSDTVSRLSNAVSKYFIAPKFRVAPLKDFAYIFPAADERWFAKAAVRQAGYKAELRDVIDNPEQRRAVVSKYQHLLDQCPDSLKAAGAIWQYAHNPQSNNANFAFIACLPEILGQLEKLQLAQFNVFHVEALPAAAVVAEVVWNGQYKKLVARDGTTIGDVPAHVPLTTVVIQMEQSGKAVTAQVVGEEVLSF